MKRPPRPSSDARSWARILTGLAIVLAGLIVVMQSGFGIVERRVERRDVPMSFFVASEAVRVEWHLAAHQEHELEDEVEQRGSERDVERPLRVLETSEVADTREHDSHGWQPEE